MFGSTGGGGFGQPPGGGQQAQPQPQPQQQQQPYNYGLADVVTAINAVEIYLEGELRRVTVPLGEARALVLVWEGGGAPEQRSTIEC